MIREKDLFKGPKVERHLKNSKETSVARGGIGCGDMWKINDKDKTRKMTTLGFL